MNREKKRCLYCHQIVIGRADKQFCCVDCKSAFHYRKQKVGNSIFQLVQAQLRKNRKILKQLFEGGFTSIEKKRAIQQGFQPYYFTAIVGKEQASLFACYEYTFEMRGPLIHITKINRLAIKQ